MSSIEITPNLQVEHLLNGIKRLSPTDFRELTQKSRRGWE